VSECRCSPWDIQCGRVSPGCAATEHRPAPAREYVPKPFAAELNEARTAAMRAVFTLRDRFAAAALQGMLADVDSFAYGQKPEEVLARTAYRYADAMLKAREAK